MVGVVHKWSEKKMGGEEDFNTVQCLRGRLLAERHASKVANEEVESICIKLIEVEKKLREEMRLRERAERRLEYLKNKLHSFNLSLGLGESHQCCTTNPPLSCCHFHHKTLCQNPDLKSTDECRLSIVSSKLSTKDSIALSTDDYSSSSTNSGDSSLEDHTHNNVNKEEASVKFQH